MQTRGATHEDLASILDIMNEVILNSTTIYEYEPRTMEYVVDWFDQRIQEGFPILVCEIDEKCVGFGSYGTFRPRAAYHFTVEHSVYIHKDFQGRGLGKLLLQELISMAKAQGYHSMIAGIDSENEGSIEFHRKAGFIEIARLPEVGYKFDRWLNLVFMQLMLNENS